MKELKTYYRVIPLYDSNYKIEKLQLYGCNRNRNCFLSEEEAKVDFLKAQEIALSKYNQILEGLEELKKKLNINFYFDYFMEGDTFGIDKDGMCINISINGYDFEFLQEI